jgi:trehalose 6-phosphate phosphatase
MTRPLLRHLDEVLDRLARSGSIWLGTDFDGTLTHHQEDAATVSLSTEMKLRLHCLAESPMMDVAIITGRSLSDITQRVGLPQLAYAGNHGLELIAPGLQWVDPVAIRQQGDIGSFAELATRNLLDFSGVTIEDKQLTVAINYRPCDVEMRSAIVGRLDAVKQHYPDLRLRHSRYGSEVLPTTTSNKGTAANLLLRRKSNVPVTAVYLGDDLTDEDAFSALQDAVTIRVGDGPTSAIYRVDSAEDVGVFFDWLYLEVSRMQHSANQHLQA